jgi:hypothetical protein
MCICEIQPDPSSTVTVAIACALSGKPVRCRRLIDEARENLERDKQPFVYDDRPGKEACGPTRHEVSYLCLFTPLVSVRVLVSALRFCIRITSPSPSLPDFMCSEMAVVFGRAPDASGSRRWGMEAFLKTKRDEVLNDIKRIVTFLGDEGLAEGDDDAVPESGYGRLRCCLCRETHHGTHGTVLVLFARCILIYKTAQKKKTEFGWMEGTNLK